VVDGGGLENRIGPFNEFANLPVKFARCALENGGSVSQPSSRNLSRGPGRMKRTDLERTVAFMHRSRSQPRATQ
jgi:hypothetical protein